MATKKETEKKFITPSCKFNTGVECYKPITCANCGWNPEVAAARIRKLQLDEYRKDHPVISIGVGNEKGCSADGS